MVPQGAGRVLPAVAAAAVAFAVIAYARTAAPIVADSDFALTELYTELATRGELTLGAYSRFGWNHPGPVYFYLQAPFYAAGGRQASSLFAAALALNVGAILAMLWVTARSTRGPLLACLAGAALLFAWRAPRLLASPWTGHIAILPALAFLLICAAIIAGRSRLLPLAFLAGSFAAQTHVSFMPLLLAFGAAAMSTVLAHARTSAVSPAKPVLASVLVLLALWIAPAAEALRHDGGNLAALARFFVTDASPDHSWREAFTLWSYGLAGVLRADFGLPWGGHLQLLEYGWITPLAVGQLLVLGVIAWFDRQGGRRFHVALTMIAITASLMGLVTVSRLEGQVVDHAIFWLAALGALNLAIVAAAVIRVAARYVPQTSSAARAPAVVAAVTVAATAVLGAVHLRDLADYERRRTTPRRIPLAEAAIRDYLGSEGLRKPLLEMRAASWSEGAGVVLRLLQEGTAVAVSADRLPMFTRRFAADGTEDVVITISPRYGYHYEQQARPGNITLLEADPVFVDAVRIAPRMR